VQPEHQQRAVQLASHGSLWLVAKPPTLNVSSYDQCFFFFSFRRTVDFEGRFIFANSGSWSHSLVNLPYMMVPVCLDGTLLSG
jgi:hypothetical protein